ncbi:MAG: DUF6788 family protein [Acidimicrobiales bacterium]
MTKRDDVRLERIRRELAALVVEGSLPGSLLVRSLRCGRRNCACHGDPPQLHGPYVQWSYSYRGKRVARWLSAEQADRLREQVERGRRIKELTAELDATEIRRVERSEGWGA